MKIFVRVTAGAHKEKIEKTGEGRYAIWVREKPKENEANVAVIKAFSRYMGVPQSRVRLKSGKTSREKFFLVGE